MSRLLLILPLTAAVAFAWGCDVFGPRACTVVGCVGGLTVQLRGTRAPSFTVTAAAADGTTRTLECPDGGSCVLVFEEFTPSSVTITYESDDQTVQQTFEPVYTRTRPNGEDCPPECLTGTVVLDLDTG